MVNYYKLDDLLNLEPEDVIHLVGRIAKIQEAQLEELDSIKRK